MSDNEGSVASGENLFAFWMCVSVMVWVNMVIHEGRGLYDVSVYQKPIKV